MLASLGFLCWFTGTLYMMPAETYGKYEVLAYLLLSHVLAGVLHVQICLSHFAMTTYSGHAYNDDTDEWFRMQVQIHIVSLFCKVF